MVEDDGIIHNRDTVRRERGKWKDRRISVYLCIHSAKYIKVRPLARGQR